MNRTWMSLIAILIVGLGHSQSQAEEWGPWSISQDAPVMGSGRFNANPVHGSSENPIKHFLIQGVRFFQKTISPVDGDRCSMTPTCSHYSLQAIRKHGALLGFMMSADRIVHEYEEQKFIPLVWDGVQFRFYDPVENNDFWFPRKPQSKRDQSTQGRE